jgi:hypothetical protein
MPCRLGYALFLAATSLLSVIAADPAHAATVTVTPRGDRTQLAIEFDGIIALGDADRLLEAGKQIKTSNKVLAGIFLNSEGGSVLEAAEIAQGLYEAKAAGGKHAVLLLPGRVCASACFLILACAPQRYADVTARVGLHSARNANDREDAGSYIADTLMARIAKKCGVPDYLIGKMVTTSPDNIYWLSRQDLISMGVQVRNSGERNSGESAASHPSPKAAKGGEDAGPVTALSDLHLRTALDPGAVYARFACVMQPTAPGCEKGPSQTGTAQAPVSAQALASKKCGTGPRLQVVGCQLSGYGPLYCLEFRRQLEAASGCQW